MESKTFSFNVTIKTVELNDIKELLGYTTDEQVTEWLAEMYYYYTKDHFSQFCISPMIDPT